MDFVSNREPQIKEMLQIIGVSTVEELFAAIPQKLKQARPTEDDGLSEYEGLQLMQSLADKNTFSKYDNYLGAGAYEHHIPALVGAVCGKSEFLTSYTPYQAEASQGMLQIIFEFQSAICALTGMDVSNASLYDGASACAEAVLMSMRLQKERNTILIAETLHPHYRGVIEQYLKSHDVKLETIPTDANGQVDVKAFSNMLGDNTCAVLLQSPNFLGIMENASSIFAQAQKAGAIAILCANPMSYGLYASAGELGADIAVGDCQPFGIALQFGGPYAGYIACKQDYVRQLPGRIVGETVDTEGRRGFVLTLQAREQHIRREKATSNICTNQALAALASLVAMLWYGKKGIHDVALLNFQKASYLRSKLETIPGVKTFQHSPIFNEFAIHFGRPLQEVLPFFRFYGIEPGVNLGRYNDKWRNYLLIAVTETKTQNQLDQYVEVAVDMTRKSQLLGVK